MKNIYIIDQQHLINNNSELENTCKKIATISKGWNTNIQLFIDHALNPIKESPELLNLFSTYPNLKNIFQINFSTVEQIPNNSNVLMNFYNFYGVPIEFYKKLIEKNCTIIFDYIWEANINFYIKPIEWLFNEIGDLSKFCILHSGSQITDKSSYNKLKNRTGLKIIDFMFFRYREINEGIKFSKNIDSTQIFNLETIKHKFLFLNNVPKIHRVLMLKKIHENNLLKNNIISARFKLQNSIYSGVFKTIQDAERKIFKETREKICLKDFSKILPIFIEYDLEGNFSDRFINPEWIYSTALQVVGETFYFKKDQGFNKYSYYQTFCTEKSYKPFYTCRPAVILSCPNHLKELKRQGFETWGDYIDESYDTELDPVKRLDMCFESINNFDKTIYKDKKFLEILKHNHEHFNNYELASKNIESDFERIFK